ncbi:cation:H+ antiporter [Sinobaca qinghaiensis]|uniref:Cation:H+ antiporter n=1 Tax=Sinobaca qinghaiensis TaxID=342944 RepID=A0A419V6I1_9BACL|nr:sodium:calcium antiporter [Sinobaca qinghaiensis]RKD75592.1 cation:H+ antiporter [Sinobaca qinghaiensis]
MIYILFLIAALVTIFAAVQLSTYADVISEKSKWGGMMVGTILLAGATSLPEVTASVTAVLIDSPDIAVGNVLGSNLFNILIIGFFDLVYRKDKIFASMARSNIYTALLGVFLTGMVFFALIIRTDISILGIGIDSIIILLTYVIGMIAINKFTGSNEVAAPALEAKSPVKKKSIPLKKAQTGFLIAAVITLIAGSALTFSGDGIATRTGIGASFVGSFLIAASTSLPEGVSVFIALKLRNYNLALGSILGSNLFNMILLTVSDIFYFKGPVIAASSQTNLITSTAIALLSCILVYSIMRARKKVIRYYTLPSIAIVVIYFVSSYLIFIAN